MRVEMKAIETKRPRRLDLNAPLLSTRRPNLSGSTSIDLSRSGSLGGSCDRVPFQWEKSPGKPKDTASREIVEDFKAFPLPKPPTIRWQTEPALTLHCVDDQYGSEEEDIDSDEDDGRFSDAIDLLSLAESLCSSNEKLEGNLREGYESDIGDSNGSLSPNFMIQRFLPAATALAASSLSALSTDNNVRSAPDITCSNDKQLMRVYANSNMTIKGGSCIPRVAGEAYNSTKACGLELLFPWRVKHRLCGVKSPVRRVRPSLKLQLSPKKN